MSQTAKNDADIVLSPAILKEIYIIPLEKEHYLIYAPLHRFAFITNTQIAHYLTALQAGIHPVVAEDISSLLPYLSTLKTNFNGKAQLQQGNPFPTALTLFLTTACNLRCSYCYANAGDTAIEKMSIATATRGIDYILSNIAKKNFIADNCQQPRLEYLQLSYHGGGEPTANWQVLHDSFHYAQQQAHHQGVMVNASLATNGVLKDAQIDWIAQHIGRVGVSFGGLPELHDKHRFMANGAGSSQRVMHTLQRFDELGVIYTLRLTLTTDQLNQLPDAVRFICAHYRPHKIHIEPAHSVGRGATQSPLDVEHFLAAYRQAQHIAQATGHTLYYATADIKKLTTHYCGISQDTFALSPQGNVSACYASFSEAETLADVFFYGKPEEKGKGYSFDLNKLNVLRQQTVTHKPACQSCYAKWHCAGDCHHEARIAQTDVASLDRCQITRALVKDQLVEKINENNEKDWMA
ncbi:radical SAM/SPASM domain-containing protein [Beggiatoa leptomitoformis]|uniref:Radical SAM protein n=1 Tax=Beggiatoa leptomitoformis TaxID=288004 RepID=A0A2N9YGG1_9GAMM|nr:radical SAM protein [Beggiatoa leptomitoformis]ALG68140.1 radical SAM protein [Beggiatoa leptomitoformis]AUI69563.1 radical SAM protein [Beggiatoa leptomitoformis]